MSAIVNASAAWLLTYALHSTLLLGVAYLVLRRTRSAALRDLLWKVAAFGAVLSASAQSVIAGAGEPVEPLAGRWEMPPMPTPQPVIEAAPPLVITPTPAITSSNASESTDTPAATFRIPRPSWQSLIVGAWVIGAAVSLLFLLRRYARARRRFVGRYPADPELLGRVESLCLRANLHRAVRVTRCASVHSPVALGRREICLPDALLRVLPPPQRDSMLAHELAHLDRNDPLWLTSFAWLEALLFFQPLNRIARRGFQQAAEQLCDQFALTHTDSPIALAQCLAEVARWLRGESEPLPYPTMAEGASSLLDRVQRVLSGAREPITTSLRARWSAVGGVVLFAAVAPVITGATLPLSRVTDLASPDDQDADIDAAVRRTSAGIVRFSYETRPTICGTGEEKDGTRMFALQPGRDWLPADRPDQLALYVWDRGALKRNVVGVGGTWTTPCLPGLARVDLTVTNGTVARIDLSVGNPAPRVSAPLTDVQTVDAGEAANYLLTLTDRDANDVSKRALIAAMMARNALTPAMLQALIDRQQSSENLRYSARAWLRTFRLAERQEPSVSAVLARYDRIPDRAARVETIAWLSEHENDMVRSKLMAIVRDAAVLEEQQAALRALERSPDADARAFAARYRAKQPPVKDEAVFQSALAKRIAAAPDGVVHLSYAARPEACGSGIDGDAAGMFALLPNDRWEPGGRGMAAFFSFDADDFTRLALKPDPSWTNRCVNGPVHALLSVSEGQVTNLRIAVGRRLSGVSITSEIEVPGPEAANYLIELASRAGQAIASNAILAAIMADGGATLYPQLLQIATDLTRPERVRQTALHWVAHDPTPGASEAIRRNAASLPRATGETQSDHGNNPASLGEFSARLSNSESLSLELTVGIVVDERQPLETRKKAIKWAEEKDLSPAALSGLYDHIQNRDLRLFLVRFLADCDNEVTSRKLIAIAESGGDLEIKQAALTSLRMHQNAVAKAYR